VRGEVTCCPCILPALKGEVSTLVEDELAADILKADIE